MMRVWKIEIFAIVADASYSLYQLYHNDEFCFIIFYYPFKLYNLRFIKYFK